MPASETAEPTVFDYVIVGAGSAGCVLASRLTEDPDVRVLLLEAGPVDHAWDWRLHMPAALAYPLRSERYNWAYESEPEPHMDGRRMHCPRGRVLGGSSSINGMAYVRGHARDYDRWAQSGLGGWDYAHLLPYFKRAESHAVGGDLYRGTVGPLQVATGACRNPLYQAFIEAGQQAGYPFTADMNGYQQEGFGAMDRTTHRGRRWSTARAYLRPALRRPNLTLRTGTLATRVRCEGWRAIGVEYAADGGLREIRATREVILAGGTINSPQLLLLSGIGGADRLAGFGIPVIADLPGVGQNLQDHLEIYVQHACTRPVSLYPRPASPGTSSRSASNGCCSAAASAPPTSSRPAPSSARRRASSTRICSIISCRSRSITTAATRIAATASRRTSGRCARPRSAACSCAPAIPASRHRSCSTTWPPRATAARCAPRSA